MIEGWKCVEIPALDRPLYRIGVVLLIPIEIEQISVKPNLWNTQLILRAKQNR
jgi:hypothetical protein